jgi:glycosyl transferase family 25
MNPAIEPFDEPVGQPPAATTSAATTAATSPAGPRVNDLVDAVFVISVRSFEDRVEHMRAEMARFGITFEWVFDFDPDAIPAELLARVFAPSDLRLPHKSLVLKHVATWRACFERGYRRVLVFEDDVVLGPDFPQVLAQAMRETESLDTPYLVYLGCGDNRYAPGAATSPSMLLPGGPLSAADAIVFDREAARRRLRWLDQNRVTRPADWLMREIDAECGVLHYWLREPVVEQGSMNGRFASSLDAKRRVRGRWYAWLRYRWDRWRHRTLGGRTIHVQGR